MRYIFFNRSNGQEQMPQKQNGQIKPRGFLPILNKGLSDGNGGNSGQGMQGGQAQNFAQMAQNFLQQNMQGQQGPSQAQAMRQAFAEGYAYAMMQEEARKRYGEPYDGSREHDRMDKGSQTHESQQGLPDNYGGDANGKGSAKIGFATQMNAMSTYGRGEQGIQDDQIDYAIESEDFLKELEECFEEMPETWKQYGADMKGRTDIAKMEMKELSKALDQKDDQKICKEILHLTGALFYLWKGLNESTS